MKQLLISLFFLVTLSFLGRGQAASDSTRAAVEVDSLIQLGRTLNKQAKYEDAMKVLEAAKNQAGEAFGTASLRFARCTYSLGKLYQAMGKPAEAEPLYLQAMLLVEKLVGKENEDYAICIYNLGQLYHNKGEYKKAESCYLDAYPLLEKALGNENPNYIGCLNNLGNLYRELGKYDKAETLHLEVLAIRGKVFGKEHPDYAASLNNLANVLKDKGDYDKAEALHLEAKNIREKVLGKESRDYAASVDNLGSIYSYKGDYVKALQLFWEAKNIREKVPGKESRDYTTSLNNLSNTYRNKGEFAKAASFNLEAQATFEKVLGKDNSSYVGNLFNLALVYNDMEEYDKAERLLLEARAIYEKLFGKEHPKYAKILKSLATCYYYKGEYDKAERFFLESKAILERTVGKGHPTYSDCVGSLALVYHDKGDYAKAQSCYLESGQIVESASGKTNPDYAQNLINLAVLYQDLGEYNKAIATHLEAKAIIENVYGKEDRSYANVLNNLANIFLDNNQIDQAEPMFLEVRTIYEKVFGTEHSRYASALFNLALVYQDKHDLNKAESYFTASNRATMSLIQKATLYSSEKEMLQYHALFEKRFGFLLRYTLAHPTDTLIATVYNNTLALNNNLLFSSLAREKSIAQADSSTCAIYTEWKSCHYQLAQQYALAVSERNISHVTRLEEQANAYEKELARRAPDFVKSQQEAHWRQVKNQLKPTEAAIEFVHFNVKEKNKTDSTFYAALILRPEWPSPRLVKLFEQHAIQPLLAAANTAASAGQLYALRAIQNGQKNTRGSQGQGIVIPGQKSANLYQLNWAPIDSLLKGCTTVYYAPSGLLHRLNLGAIAVPGTDQTLADRYQLVQLGSTRQLIGYERNTVANNHIATLFGGLRYDADAPAPQPDSADQTFAAYDVATLRSALGGRGGDAWIYLPGTEKEVKNAGIALKNAGFTVKTFSGNQGTEAAFKTLGQHENPAPTVLHIATHGFFFPDPKDSTNRNALRDDREPVFKTSDNPLLRSGLILAGANPAWAGAHTPEAQEDGILTAYEISQMNLRSTELVVLSACETGLGDIENNEGVYGLKRAFKIAGARYLIMSLWQVPDKQTQELMSVFYKNRLEQKMDIPTAFAAAQKSMRKRYSDPFFWAGFVLVE